MTSRLCPTAPRNFGKRGEGGLWGCSCDSLCLCVPLHPPEALQDPAVPPGPPARGSVCVGCLGQRTLLARQSGGRSSTEVLGRRPPGGLMANVPKVLAAELSRTCVCAPLPSARRRICCFSTCVSTANRKKNGSKPPFSMKCQLGARGAVKAVPGEDCRPLEPRAAPTVSVLNIVGNAQSISLLYFPFPPSFFNERNKPQNPPQDEFHSC